MTTDVTLPFTDNPWSFGPAAESLPVGGSASIGVGTFTLRPNAGFSGSTVELTLDFGSSLSGLREVGFYVGDHRLGPPAPIDGLQLTVRRSLPELEPGTHEIMVVGANFILARAEFIVLEDPKAGATGGTTTTIFTAVLGGLVIGLAWFAFKTVRSSASPGSRLGVMEGRRVRRGLPPHE